MLEIGRLRRRGMDEIIEQLEKTLPRVEEYTDCCGRVIQFKLYLERLLTPGYLLAAQEVTDNEHGYHFCIHAEADPFVGLGRLRRKIRRGISRKYLVRRENAVGLSHDELSGSINHFGLVVDGELVERDLDN
jgi:hypothetical protein